MNQQKFISRALLYSMLFFVSSMFAQSTPRAQYLETEFGITLPSENKWSFNFGLVNRYLLKAQLEGETLDEDAQQHVELNHFTNYRTSDNIQLSFGLRYRFRETFDEGRKDEFRMIEQISYRHRGLRFSPRHRVRFEQRFRELTIFRLRYQLKLTQPLSEEFSMGLSTEFLYSMIKNYRPESDQRITLSLGNSSIRNLDLSAGVEFRREDFTGAPGSQFHFLVGANLQL